VPENATPPPTAPVDVVPKARLTGEETLVPTVAIEELTDVRFVSFNLDA